MLGKDGLGGKVWDSSITFVLFEKFSVHVFHGEQGTKAVMASTKLNLVELFCHASYQMIQLTSYFVSNLSLSNKLTSYKAFSQSKSLEDKNISSVCPVPHPLPEKFRNGY